MVDSASKIENLLLIMASKYLKKPHWPKDVSAAASDVSFDRLIADSALQVAAYVISLLEVVLPAFLRNH